MMKLWNWRKPTTPLRDAANVIADAVTAAKDQQIKEAQEALAGARIATHSKRARLQIALDEVHQLWASNVVRMGDDITGSNVDGKSSG